MKSARSGMLTKYVLRLRTHEWAEHQAVSLLDIEGIGKSTIIALWEIGTTTAQAILQADAHELAKQLRPYGLPRPSAGQTPEQVIESWQKQIATLWQARRGDLPKPIPNRPPKLDDPPGLP